MNSEKDEDERFKGLKSAAPYMGLGIQLAATVVLMFFLGKWLDDEFELFPYLTIIFSIFGAFAAIYNFIKVVLELNKKNEKN